jgi:hypothetical protein
LGDQIEKNEMAGQVTCMGEKKSAYSILVGKREGNRLLGRPRCRWEDNIKMDLQKLGWGGDIDWIDLDQDRDRWQALVNVVMNLQVPQNAGNFLTR